MNRGLKLYDAILDPISAVLYNFWLLVLPVAAVVIVVVVILLILRERKKAKKKDE